MYQKTGSRIDLWTWSGCQGQIDMTTSRAVIGLLTGHNTMRRHLHMLGLTDSPLCRKYVVEEETSDHILCKCEVLASFRHVHLGSFFLEPEDIQRIIWGLFGTLVRPRAPLKWTWVTKGLLIRPRRIRSCEAPYFLIRLHIFLNILFSKNLSLCSILSETDQVSQQNKRTGKIIVLYILKFIFLYSELEEKRFCSK